MIEYQKTANAIYQQFYKQALAEGIVFSDYDQENGIYYIPYTAGKIAEITLFNLIDYYWNTRDENAVNDFVQKIKTAAAATDNPTWEEVKENVYFSPCSHEIKTQNPYIKHISKYFCKLYVINTLMGSFWILPNLVEKWGITEEVLEKQVLENGARLLARTSIEVGDVDGHGHFLGSFDVKDYNLTAACLFAPGLKEKVSKDFGWPLYFVFPNKLTCYFFGKEHFSYFKSRIGRLVIDYYENLHRITPELLELSDSGIKPLCSWQNTPDSLLKLPGETLE